MRSVVVNIYTILTAFLAAGCVYLYFSNSYLEKKVNALESEKNALKSDLAECQRKKEECNEGIKRFNEAQDKAGERIAKVRTVVKTVRSDCDCWNIALPDGVREQLSR